jgi:hypothetical protein
MAQEQDNTASGLTAKSVAKYALLPGIFPRLQRMAGHFSQFLFMFTQIFGSVGLIDRNHPCLKPENIGRYRFNDIVGLAASNVVFDRKHMPQVIMFFMVMLSIVLTAAIILGLIASTIFTVHTAHAQFFGQPQGFSPTGGNSVTYTTGNDWALNFLFRIFGDTPFFHVPANAAQGGSVGNPWFTAILVGMLKYYSMAMLVVASFMILYILIITLTESARTGEPFGSRFDGIWAPVRLALAIGLLLPIVTPGYNGAQMIAFQAAVWGSNLATNVWYGGIQAMSGSSQNFFAATMADPGYRFVRDIFMVNLCVDGLSKQAQVNWKAGTMQYTAVSSKDTITYSFGPASAPDFCGQVTFLRSSVGLNAAVNELTGDATGTGASFMKPNGITGTSWPEQTIQAYQSIAKQFLPIENPDSMLTGQGSGTDSGNAAVSAKMADVVHYATANIINKGDGDAAYFGTVMAAGNYGSDDIVNWMKLYWTPLGVSNITDTSRDPFFTASPWPTTVAQYNTWLINSLTQDAKYGWTSAGVFYLRISSAMATISKVVNTPPTVSIMPSNFTKSFATPDNPTANTSTTPCAGMNWDGVVAGVKSRASNLNPLALSPIMMGIDLFSDSAVCKKYKLSKQINNFLQGGKTWFLEAIKSDSNAYTLMDGENFDRALEISEPETSTNLQAGAIMRPILDALSDITRIDSRNLNPLGAVVVWGNTLMAVAGIAYAIGIIGLGFGWVSMAFTLGNLLMLPGFVLAFWVPTLPFMHFTFAVIEWMISILEAIIGMPLWALSMITLEGDGLGQLGTAGVKRLFEIILRPSVIVMSLIASVIIFSAGVSFFNDALSLYAQASSQANADQNFFQASIAGFGMIFVYMFGIYSLATSCFKLIDSIPDKFGRWFGLEGGFGSDIKTGMSGLQDIVVGAATFKGLTNIGKNVGGTLDKRYEKKAAARATKKGKK